MLFLCRLELATCTVGGLEGEGLLQPVQLLLAVCNGG